MNVEETEGDALRRIAGQNVELTAEVSRLGQQLSEAEAVWHAFTSRIGYGDGITEPSARPKS
jgi:hypothetical protein